MNFFLLSEYEISNYKGCENMEFVIGYIIGLVLTGILIIVVSGRAS